MTSILSKRLKYARRKLLPQEMQLLTIPVAAGTLLAVTEQDTGVKLPTGDVYVHDVVVEATTAEATGTGKTVSVGLLSSQSGGSATRFGTGKSVAAIGGVLCGGNFVPASVVARNISWKMSNNDFVEFVGNIHVWYVRQ